LVGWTASKSQDNVDIRTCRPRKLGLPILGYNECIKAGMDAMNFNDDYGCIGIVNTNSLVCQVSTYYYIFEIFEFKCIKEELDLYRIISTMH